MHTWRARIAELLHQWRLLRSQGRVADQARRDQRAADELQKARDGYDRFPPTGV